MKRIILGTVIVERDTPNGRASGPLSVAAQLYEWVRFVDPMQGGVKDLAEYEKRLEIMRALRTASETESPYIDFEDADHALLGSAVRAALPRIGWADEGFLACMQRVRDAKTPEKE